MIWQRNPILAGELDLLVGAAEIGPLTSNSTILNSICNLTSR